MYKLWSCLANVVPIILSTCSVVNYNFFVLQFIFALINSFPFFKNFLVLSMKISAFQPWDMETMWKHCIDLSSKKFIKDLFIGLFQDICPHQRNWNTLFFFFPSDPSSSSSSPSCLKKTLNLSRSKCKYQWLITL